MTNEVLPIESVGKLSKEKRDILVRAQIILDTRVVNSGSVPSSGGDA